MRHRWVIARMSDASPVAGMVTRACAAHALLLVGLLADVVVHIVGYLGLGQVRNGG